MKTYNEIAESKDLEVLSSSYLENYKKNRLIKIKEENQKSEKDIKYDAQLEANELNELFTNLDRFNDKLFSKLCDDIQTLLLNAIHHNNPKDNFDDADTVLTVIELMNTVNSHRKIISTKQKEYELIAEKLSIME